MTETSVRFLPSGAALTGLQVHSPLQDGSPDKARQAPPPGNMLCLKLRCGFFPVALR
ncbi:hypothetical protein HV127_24845 [Klebsiella sp. RHBSTW-00215]|uniref:hypothetical protein n=1 Tax=Klebsiella sp. RHBSTW-00215 TaxID=2742640 RepID=UPI0015F55F0B|nr:hypothetical protein [Klebsiella sp. RHBSTW-00215]MBA7934445.1 hypothetical protein [Klebsiella sp. RHBSTW-00215]